MARLLVFALLLLLVAPGACAPARKDGESVRRAERHRYDAIIARDWDEVARCMADEFRYHEPDGRTNTKETYLARSHSGGMRVHEAEIEQLEVELHGDVATSMGLVHQRHRWHGREQEARVRFLNVWVWRDGRWQLAARQSNLRELALLSDAETPEAGEGPR